MADVVQLQVEPVTAGFGAVVSGIDLAGDPSDADREALRRAVVAHGVVFLRGQRLTDEQHLALARSWGELHVYPPFRLAGQEVPLEWVEDTVDSPPKATRWHTDLSWEPRPPKFGLLSAQVVPDAGGDTIWADTAGAYDALSPVMKRCLEGLRVHHKVEAGSMDRLAALVAPEPGAAFRREYAGGVEQPLVRANGDDGRLALFVAGYWMDHIVGMSRSESDALLRFLMEHATQPRFQCRWRWSVHDLAIWDERRTMHIAMPDHYPRHRLLRRCTVVGERPLAASAAP
jgi:taurine dioxygenase